MKRTLVESEVLETKRSCNSEGCAASAEHRTLMIAGGTDGIGLAFLDIALRSRRYGKIFVLGRNFEQVQKLRRQLLQAEENIIAVEEVQCDITQEERLRVAISSLPTINDFVNTIGSFIKGVVAEMTSADVEEHFKLNTVANINLTRAVLPKLQPGNSQLLVCSASLANQARSPYALQSATKAGYKFFIDALRVELRGKVRVMVVLPPSVNTQIFKKGGDHRDTSIYPPPARVGVAMDFMLSLPNDVSVPEMLMEQFQPE